MAKVKTANLKKRKTATLKHIPSLEEMKAYLDKNKISINLRTRVTGRALETMNKLEYKTHRFTNAPLQYILDSYKEFLTEEFAKVGLELSKFEYTGKYSNGTFRIFTGYKIVDYEKCYIANEKAKRGPVNYKDSKCDPEGMNALEQAWKESEAAKEKPTKISIGKKALTKRIATLAAKAK